MTANKIPTDEEILEVYCMKSKDWPLEESNRLYATDMVLDLMKQARTAGREEGLEEQREAILSDVRDDWDHIYDAGVHHGKEYALNDCVDTILKAQAIRNQEGRKGGE